MKKMKTKNPYLLTILLSTSLLGMYVSQQVTYFILATNGMNTANTIYNDKSTLTIQAKPPPSPPELDLRFYEDVACTKTITDIYFPFVGGGVVLGHNVNSSVFYIKAICNSKNKKVYWSWSSSPPTGVILTLHSSILAKKTETMYIENTMYGLSAGEVIAVYWNVYVNTTATLGSFSWICTFSIYSSPNG